MKFSLAIALAMLSMSLAARADEPKSSLPPELKWVPANAVGFVHVRFAHLWDSPAGNAVRTYLGAAAPEATERIERGLGVPLANVETITAVVPDVEAGGLRDLDVVLRVVTREPYDRAKLVEALGLIDRPDRPLGAGGSKRLFTTGREEYIHLTNARTITFFFGGGPAGLASLLLDGEPSGQLSPALEAAARGDHLVAAVDGTRLRDLPLGDSTLAESEWLQSAGPILLRGNLKPGSADFDMSASFQTADGIKGATTFLKQLQANFLDDFSRTAQRNSETDTPVLAKLIKALITGVKSVKLETHGNQLLATASMPTAEAIAAVQRDGAVEIKLMAGRMKSSNNLKQFGLAFHNYHDAYGELPSAIFDRNGKPLLSWRVAVLPQIEQELLFRQFKLDEPWDSEHNKKLIDRMPATYRLPGDKATEGKPLTYYRVFARNGAMFDERRNTRFADITDGLSNTIMAVEAADPVIWTKPDELAYDPKKPPKLGYHFGGRCNVLFGDGSVHGISKDLDPKTLHLLIQRADNTPVQVPR